MDSSVKKIKKEIIDQISQYPTPTSESRAANLSAIAAASVIDLSSSSDASDSSDADEDDINDRPKKKKKSDEASTTAVLPLGFLDPLPIVESEKALSTPTVALALPAARGGRAVVSSESNGKQFWKAGDYEGAPSGDWQTYAGGMDHVRVHPRFLHSNATSHKWVLGAFAELLDNSLDEVCNGATYVNINMMENQKDASRMLLIEDNGGGMDPDKMRQCMSLGYSAKSKIADTIGQYGNGFKTSTMRLGADVIVFSRSCGKDGKRSTQSIGLLSYTFLRSTGKEDIVVPMLDYERNGQDWNKIIRSSAGDWNRNVETIVQWSPFLSEADLLQQFDEIKDHGTRIVIYNLWEDDAGQLELDFDSDDYDILIRGANRDEKNIQMAELHPNSRHFLTYRHSLRSYASILYLRIPRGFRIILRGKDVEHHNIVNDMMMSQEVTYRPQPGADGVPKDCNMVAVVTVGFVKDAKAHIDVQGFNVYHKNRLIKPFWRVWHAPGSDGRGVIGVLEANFVEPAHDKQGFERTIVLSRLETRLVQMQKTYWSTNCHKIGYAPRRNKASFSKEDYSPEMFKSGKKSSISSGKAQGSEKRACSIDKDYRNGHEHRRVVRTKTSGRERYSSEPSSPSGEDLSDDDVPPKTTKIGENGQSSKSIKSTRLFSKGDMQTDHYTSRTRSKDAVRKGSGQDVDDEEDLTEALDHLKEENHELRERLKKKEEEILGDLLKDLNAERARAKSFEAQLAEATQKIEELNKEQENLVDIFSEERQRRDMEEENLRRKLKDASNTIEDLVGKIRQMEKMRPANGKAAR